MHHMNKTIESAGFPNLDSLMWELPFRLLCVHVCKGFVGFSHMEGLRFGAVVCVRWRGAMELSIDIFI